MSKTYTEKLKGQTAGSEEFPAFEVEADRAPIISKSSLKTRSKDGLCLLLYYHYTDIITKIITGNYRVRRNS